MVKTTKEQMTEDAVKGLDRHYEELFNIIRPINHTPRKFSEEMAFVRSGGVGKLFNSLKKIMITVDYLREHVLLSGNTIATRKV